MYGALAQLGARHIRIVEVVSSNLICSRQEGAAWEDAEMHFFVRQLFFYANSELQPNAKDSCAASFAIARENSRSLFYLVLYIWNPKWYYI